MSPRRQGNTHGYRSEDGSLIKRQLNSTITFGGGRSQFGLMTIMGKCLLDLRWEIFSTPGFKKMVSIESLPGCVIINTQGVLTSVPICHKMWFVNWNHILFLTGS